MGTRGSHWVPQAQGFAAARRQLDELPIAHIRLNPQSPVWPRPGDLVSDRQETKVKTLALPLIYLQLVRLRR